MRPRRYRNRQHPLHRPQAPIQPKLPHQQIIAQVFNMQSPIGPQNPNRIGRSNPDPSFFKSAGARLIVIRVVGISNPEFLIADRTRSRLSPHRRIRQPHRAENVLCLI